MKTIKMHVVAMRLSRILCMSVALMMLFVLTGCFAIHKSYVDPEYGKTSYQDITRHAQPFKWRIAVEFQRNGSHLPNVDHTLRDLVERTIVSSGVAVPARDNNAPELKVVVNNVYGSENVFAKSFLSGLTLGLIGYSVTDHYEMQATLSKGNTVITKTGYKHALYSTGGLIVSSPPGAEPISMSDGFAKIVEQMVLTALRDIEKDSKTVTISSLGFEQQLASFLF